MLSEIKKFAEKLNNAFKKAISNENLKLEIVFFTGMITVIYASFMINKIFGMYFLGFSLIAYSLYSLKE